MTKYNINEQIEMDMKKDIIETESYNPPIGYLHRLWDTIDIYSSDLLCPFYGDNKKENYFDTNLGTSFTTTCTGNSKWSDATINFTLTQKDLENAKAKIEKCMVDLNRINKIKKNYKIDMVADWLANLIMKIEDYCNEKRLKKITKIILKGLGVKNKDINKTIKKEKNAK